MIMSGIWGWRGDFLFGEEEDSGRCAQRNTKKSHGSGNDHVGDLGLAEYVHSGASFPNFFTVRINLVIFFSCGGVPHPVFCSGHGGWVNGGETAAFVEGVEEFRSKLLGDESIITNR